MQTKIISSILLGVLRIHLTGLNWILNHYNIEVIGMATEEEMEAQITQLQQQQAIFTQIIAQQLQGVWTGEGSVEALLYALNPNIQGTLSLDVPVTQTELETEIPKA